MAVGRVQGLAPHASFRMRDQGTHHAKLAKTNSCKSMTLPSSTGSLVETPEPSADDLEARVRWSCAARRCAKCGTDLDKTGIVGSGSFADGLFCSLNCYALFGRFGRGRAGAAASVTSVH